MDDAARNAQDEEKLDEYIASLTDVYGAFSNLETAYQDVLNALADFAKYSHIDATLYPDRHVTRYAQLAEMSNDIRLKSLNCSFIRDRIRDLLKVVGIIK